MAANAVSSVTYSLVVTIHIEVLLRPDREGWGKERNHPQRSSEHDGQMPPRRLGLLRYANSSTQSYHRQRYRNKREQGEF